VDVLEIAAGLWRWTGHHEEWKEDVGSVYLETANGVVLFDPLVPPEATERFWEALDRDVERAGGAVHVLVTVFWHTRHAARMVERYGARVWAPRRGRAAIERRAGRVTDPFRPDDALPGGVQAVPTARAAEVVYWIPEHRALVPGDALLGDGEGGVKMCPRSWLPERVDLGTLAESLRPLLDLPVERVLVSHGEPVLENGRSALARALVVK
jgi:glyoxylase-like metal-dependent hydrolase (beta-lactamase superfamily II)